MKTVNIGTYSKKAKIIKPVTTPVNYNREINPGKSVKPKRKFNKKIFLMLFVFLIIGFLGFIYFRMQSVQSRVEQYDESGKIIEACTNLLNPACWTEAFKPQLKQTDGFTNALIIGLDTRTGTNSLKNTDSIMIASFSHKTQKTMLISIPRDFYSYNYRFKINAVYALTMNKNKNDPFYYLKEEITNILTLPIHYFVQVHFDGVTELIDKLGGVEICPESAVTAQYPNDNAKPWDKQQWLYFEFPKGCQVVNGEKALVWARFRYVRKGNSAYASDFSRARRQQEIVNSLKKKVLENNSDIASKAETYWSLYQSLSKSIIVDISLEDILAGLSYLDTADKQPLNVVTDPMLGGLNRIIKSENTPATGYIIKALDKSYQTMRNEIAQIWKFADFYRDQPAIMVRNQTGSKSLPGDNLAMKIKTDTRYYQSFNVSNDAKSTLLAGIHIFDFSGGTKSLSLKYLKTFLNVDTIETDPETYGIKRSNKNEDILIVVGPDEIPPTPVPSVIPTT